MNLQSILSKLTVNEKTGQFDEATLKEIQDYISEALELKVAEKTDEIVKEKLEEEKERLLSIYEEKYEEYKQDITSKFSDFIDSILEEEFVIPEEIKEYARVGKLYEPIMEQFKKTFTIDNAIIEGEVKDTLKEALEEIESLENKVNESEAKYLELKESSREVALELHKRLTVEGLTESQQRKALAMLAEAKTKEEVDSKFEVIQEAIFGKEENTNLINEGVDNSKKPASTKTCVCPECGKEQEISEGACSLYHCQDCENVKLVDKGSEAKKPETKQVSESSDWEKLMSFYTDALRNNKI